MQNPEEASHAARDLPNWLAPEKTIHLRGKPPLSQLNCIFRLGRACSSWDSRLVAEYDVSQFYCTLLLVTALMLTACFGVAAWRLSDDASEVTGSFLPPLIDPR